MALCRFDFLGDRSWKALLALRYLLIESISKYKKEQTVSNTTDNSREVKRNILCLNIYRRRSLEMLRWGKQTFNLKARPCYLKFNRWSCVATGQSPTPRISSGYWYQQMKWLLILERLFPQYVSKVDAFQKKIY